MFWAILITAIVTLLVCYVLFLRNENRQQKSECQRLKNEKAHLSNRLDEYRKNDTRRRERTAYQKGLYDGRETDMAYREVLKRYKDGDYDERAYRGMKEVEKR